MRLANVCIGLRVGLHIALDAVATVARPGEMGNPAVERRARWEINPVMPVQDSRVRRQNSKTLAPRHGCR